MNYKSSGNFRTGKRGARTFVSSAILDDKRTSSIAVIVAVLALALITCILFVTFGDIFVFPTINWGVGGHLGNGYDERGPYATVTKKNNFVAKEGGISLADATLYSERAILVRLSDMSTVAHKNADEKMYPASMTKVMTVVVALDHIKDIDAKYLIKKSVISNMPEGASNAGLTEFVGQSLSLRDLLYGVTYLSAADSVLCLVDALGFTMDEFVSLMNDKAKEIGLKNTTFGGAIGMDSENNQSTCREIAAIMAYAMENPYCRELFGGTKYNTQAVTDLYYNATLHTSLKEFSKTTETVLDGYRLVAAKSGFEVLAGYCLVSYIEDSETGEGYVLVTAGAEAYKDPYRKTRIYDMIEIFDKVMP